MTKDYTSIFLLKYQQVIYTAYEWHRTAPDCGNTVAPSDEFKDKVLYFRAISALAGSLQLSSLKYV